MSNTFSSMYSRLLSVRNTGMYLWPNIKRKILAFGHKEKRKINLGKEKTTSVRDAIHSPFWIYSIEMPLLGYFQHFIGESTTDHCTLLNSKIERVINNCCKNWYNTAVVILIVNQELLAMLQLLGYFQHFCRWPLHSAKDWKSSKNFFFFFVHLSYFRKNIINKNKSFTIVNWRKYCVCIIWRQLDKLSNHYNFNTLVF